MPQPKINLSDHHYKLTLQEKFLKTQFKFNEIFSPQKPTDGEY